MLSSVNNLHLEYIGTTFAMLHTVHITDTHYVVVALSSVDIGDLCPMPNPW